jgi:Recombination endonuclease VII
MRDKEKKRLYDIKYRKRHPYNSEQRKQWYAKNKHLLPYRRRTDYPGKKFGLTWEEYQHLVLAQNGVCAICHRAEVACDPRTGKLRELAVDHDHNKKKGEAGFIRGLLCYRCNTGLGLLGDSADRLLAAVAYLDTRHGI